jgi:hypothetical protein
MRTVEAKCRARVPVNFDKRGVIKAGSLKPDGLPSAARAQLKGRKAPRATPHFSDLAHDRLFRGDFYHSYP